MTTDQEILEQYRNYLDIRIKHLCNWVLGESAITEMTRTVRDNDPNKLDINQLYSLFRLHFLPERNVFHRRANFFSITREKKKRNGRRCMDKNITSREKLPSRKRDTSRANYIRILITDRKINW